MNRWKLVGLAGVVGVAATGVMIAREHRRRHAYTPDEIRERLHTRLAQAPSQPATNTHNDPTPPSNRH